ncbi:MAG: hypothetical protein IJT44_10285, partial [Clostridia bacterium]|nr:hypothetical protein [Clostridia bacterium]
MKIAKRTLSVLLAVLMVFGSFGIMGSAKSNANDKIDPVNATDGKMAFGLDVYKDGVKVENGGTLSPGDVVEVQLSIGTDFYPTFLSTEVLYDSNFFEPAVNGEVLAVADTPDNAFSENEANDFLKKLVDGAPTSATVSGTQANLFDTVAKLASGGYNGLVNKDGIATTYKKWIPLYMHEEIKGVRKQANAVEAQYAHLHFVGIQLTMGPDSVTGGKLIKIPYAPYFSFQLRVKDGVTTNGAASAEIFVPIGGARRAAK